LWTTFKIEFRESCLQVIKRGSLQYSLIVCISIPHDD
jgi:hypothetical protein